MSIGIYDYDFINCYKKIPSLECAKLASYYTRKRENVVLSQSPAVHLFNKFFIQKNEDDGAIIKNMNAPNCHIGGRAFSPSKYIPMDYDIENSVPDLNQYYNLRGKYPKFELEKVLRGRHIRLFTNGKILPVVEKTLQEKLGSLIVIHDYDLGKRDNCFEILKNIQKEHPSRRFLLKYRSTIKDISDLDTIRKIPFDSLNEFYYPNNFTVNDILDAPPLRSKIYYDYFPNSFSENDFLERLAPEIFAKAILCRSYKKKFLLNSETIYTNSPIVFIYVRLINEWIAASSFSDNTLISFIETTSKYNNPYREERYTEKAYRVIEYFRQKNPKLCDRFYKWKKVKINEKGEVIIYDE